MGGTRQVASRNIEIWGGFECTINRVHDQWFDQFEIAPLAGSIEAIDAVADLGIRTLRYPLLWERIAPDNPRDGDWSWADARMNRMRDRGITPIVGLMHHGSGPSHSSLLDPDLAKKLSRYARAVAERYPDMKYVTPINEPLTTARFSTLYGHWYPHHQSAHSFALALLRQCTAVREAMRAMREVVPGIQLVQTEDIGLIRSTPELAYQAAYENRRRWLTFDLLSGFITDRHTMWTHLAVSREAIDMLESLVDDPCPPDIIGVNHYVTSDRYLDHRLDLYPGYTVGGNGKDRYVDLEAVRGPEQSMSSHETVLTEAWERYGIPVALTEAHLACSREQQVRWLLDAWEGAHRAARGGAHVIAITAWALMGSYGWDKLLTSPPFSYESGAFDVRSGRIRRTAVGAVIKDLANRGETTHVAASAKPWWRHDSIRPASRRLVITGANGTLGKAFARVCRSRGIQCLSLRREDFDITDASKVAAIVSSASAVVNAAGFVSVGEAESHPTLCNLVNAAGPRLLAEACVRAGVPFVTFSSDLVFDGGKNSPYVESDNAGPRNVYGASKAQAERDVLAANPSALLIRTSAFFGPWDKSNFAVTALRQMTDGSTITLPYDGIVSPTYIPELVDVSLDLMLDGECGIWHLANDGAVSWADFAALLATRHGYTNPDDLFFERRPTTASYPRYSALGTERGVKLSTLEEAVDRFFVEAAIPQPALVSA